MFLKTLVGLLRPDRGSVRVAGRDLMRLRERDLYEVRKLFGVLFQDGALFGSMSLYDNIAFPLREHTRKRERRSARSCWPRSRWEVGRLLRGNRDTLPVLLGNLVAAGQVTTTRLDGIEQLLVAYPQAVAAWFTVAPGGAP